MYRTGFKGFTSPLYHIRWLILFIVATVSQGRPFWLKYKRCPCRVHTPYYKHYGARIFYGCSWQCVFTIYQIQTGLIMRDVKEIINTVLGTIVYMPIICSFTVALQKDLSKDVLKNKLIDWWPVIHAGCSLLSDLIHPKCTAIMALLFRHIAADLT